MTVELITPTNELTSTSAVVLLSGGLDSSAALHFALAQRWLVKSLHVDYGHPAAARERKAAKAVASTYAVELSLVDVKGLAIRAGGEISGRNALLAVLGLMTLGSRPGIIVLGLHAGTPYADSMPPFVRLMQTVFDTYRSGEVIALAPFLAWNKRDIWDYARGQGVDTSLTYSCELGLDQPCGQCKSCADLRALDAAT
jgi:7-cyano-7-deazaguanine synthase